MWEPLKKKIILMYPNNYCIQYYKCTQITIVFIITYLHVQPWTNSQMLTSLVALKTNYSLFSACYMTQNHNLKSLILIISDFRQKQCSVPSIFKNAYGLCLRCESMTMMLVCPGSRANFISTQSIHKHSSTKH